MKTIASVLLIIFSIGAVNAEAQLKKRFGGILGGKSGGSGTAVNLDNTSGGATIKSLSESQGDLLQQYIAAKGSVAEANSIIAEALGLKQEAAAYKATAEKLNSGNVTTKKEMNKHTKVSDKANDKINKELDKNEELDEERKGMMGKAMTKYGVSLAQSRMLYLETKPYYAEVKRIVLNSNLIQKAQAKKKLSDGIFVAKGTPGHIRNVKTTFTKLHALSKSQNIKYPKDATKELNKIKDEDLEDLEEL